MAIFPGRLPSALLNAFEINDRINQYLIENLPSEAWATKPPDGKGRTVAAIVSHMHNVRVMWLKAAKFGEIPDQLDRETVRRRQLQPSAPVARLSTTSCAMPWRQTAE